ncbi:Phospholipase protein [Spatholobus suberectus]|nr:Phospholipase protein [Spatholobus suberectus]
MHKRRTTKKIGKQVRVMDSSSCDSPNNQSGSWDYPPSERKHLIPDSTVISTRRASLRSAKKFIETTTTSVQAYQVPECSVAELESPPRQVAHPSTFAPEIRHEVGDSVAPENCSVDVAEMGENPMTNHSIQMEGHNAFEAECIPLEREPLAKDIQESSNSRERADKNNGKSLSLVEHSSSRFSLNLTEMVNMWDNEGDDEVNFFGQSSPRDTVEGYQVKPKFMPILRRILSKHGDIFKDSMVTTMTFQSIFLEVIGDIISELQDKGLHKITEDELHKMIGLANEMKNMKVNIEWLHLRLEEIFEARQILKQSGMLKEKKDSNKKVIEAVKTELEQYEAEKKALEAKFRSLLDKICHKEAACKETLARAQDESARISETITYAKSKVRRFVNCSLADGLL